MFFGKRFEPYLAIQFQAVLHLTKVYKSICYFQIKFKKSFLPKYLFIKNYSFYICKSSFASTIRNLNLLAYCFEN